MTLDEYNDFCGSLPASSHVIQWGGAHVWKVADKIFAVGGWGPKAPSAQENVFVTFKVLEISYEILKEQEGCRPAPYLASRGMKWIQCTGHQTIDFEGLCQYIAESHRLVSQGLSKKKRAELGLT